MALWAPRALKYLKYHSTGRSSERCGGCAAKKSPFFFTETGRTSQKWPPKTPKIGVTSMRHHSSSLDTASERERGGSEPFGAFGVRLAMRLTPGGVGAYRRGLERPQLARHGLLTSPITTTTKTCRAASELSTKPRAAVSFGALRFSVPPPPPETDGYVPDSPMIS